MSKRKDPGTDPRIYSGHPSIREKLWRQYNAALENDAPIDPTLDELLFGSTDDEPYYELPLLQKVKPKEREPRRDGGAAGLVPLGPVDSMPPANHEPETLGRCMGGYDGGFESGMMGDWDKDAFYNLVTYLDEKRQPGESSIVSVGGKEFELKPHGGGDGVYYRYIIEGAGWKVLFHHAPECGVQPVRFRFGFEALCGRSLFDVHAELMQWLDSIGFNANAESEKISRIDVQCMFERPVEDFVRPVAHEHTVMRARDGAVYLSSRHPTSFNFGSNTMIRTYDKKRELLERCDEFGLRMIAKYCCGGSIPDHLTRVEFQIRRDSLNVMGIHTIKDLREMENSLVDYLTYDWFRIIDGPRKKGHTHEQEVAEVWREVREAFSKYFPGGDEKREIARRSGTISGLKCTGEDLVRQAAGCLATMYAKCKGAASEVTDIISYINDRFNDMWEDMYKKIGERAKKFEVLTGCVHADSERSLDPRYAMAGFDPDSARRTFE